MKEWFKNLWEKAKKSVGAWLTRTFKAKDPE